MLPRKVTWTSSHIRSNFAICWQYLSIVTADEIRPPFLLNYSRPVYTDCNFAWLEIIFFNNNLLY